MNFPLPAQPQTQNMVQCRWGEHEEGEQGALTLPIAKAICILSTAGSFPGFPGLGHEPGVFVWVPVAKDIISLALIPLHGQT